MCHREENHTEEKSSEVVLTYAQSACTDVQFDGDLIVRSSDQD